MTAFVGSVIPDSTKRGNQYETEALITAEQPFTDITTTF